MSEPWTIAELSAAFPPENLPKDHLIKASNRDYERFLQVLPFDQHFTFSHLDRMHRLLNGCPLCPFDDQPDDVFTLVDDQDNTVREWHHL